MCTTKDTYPHSSHSKYIIKLHFVFAVKYRKKRLTGNLDQDIKQIMFNISKQKGFTIDTMQTDVDHIHILMDIAPRLSVFYVMHQLKQIATFRIYQKHRSFLKLHFWKENTFWSGYFFFLLEMHPPKQFENILKHRGKHCTFAYIPEPKGIGVLRSNR
ncbi:IS200/IS605 family transposase [Flavobacterium sp. ZS1P14]|uniref:IS200/IS605 family transposase n=1 Tax=Flavobacterium sp. ZS1P14 TaxID=3401729 RepID=UPI003AAD1C29